MVQAEMLLPIRPILVRLRRLDNTQQVENFLNEGENEAVVNNLIVTGINQLTQRYNLIYPNDTLLKLPIMQRTRDLKLSIGRKQLPLLNEITARELVAGIHNVIPAILTGQETVKGINTEGRDKIRTPSMLTNPLALTVGTAFHVLERTEFERLRQQGIQGIRQTDGGVRLWKIDDIIYPLEECAMLLDAEARSGIGVEKPILLKIIASPNSLDEDGGVGWRTAEQVETFRRQYAIDQLTAYFSFYNVGNEQADALRVIESFQKALSHRYPNSQSAFLRLVSDFIGDKKSDPEDLARMGLLAGMIFN